ncbi:unnamed protein product [Enterobius vermicularis]|uniref:Enkurin domain-containing protein n=1 Tax=Enterobius vermicularis TaxID=51028 RepID=A0A0N4VPJ6_ENTVE|nr:unnamed protein product [Enterobius vermicularis]
MDAEKNNNYASNISAPMLNNEIIGELSSLTDGINSLPRYREERRQMLADRELQMLKEIEDVKKNYTPEMFVDQTPDHFSSSDVTLTKAVKAEFGEMCVGAISVKSAKT